MSALDIGTVTARPGYVRIVGDHGQLYAWANRAGARWPCSDLATHDRVSAEICADNGDLIELAVIHDGRDDEAPDLTGAELTAWIDDNLAVSPFAHLARNPIGG